MQVKEAIKRLSELESDDHIVIAWWTKNDFFHWADPEYDWVDPPVSDKEWEYATEEGDDIDWCWTHESIHDAMKHWIEEERKGS